VKSSLAFFMSFQEVGLNEHVIRHLSKPPLTIASPTPIQYQVLKTLLPLQQASPASYPDVLIRAETGSGKTLSYFLPILNVLMRLEPQHRGRQQGLLVLIVSPRRELASQIYSVIHPLLRCCVSVVAGVLVGGEKKKSEKARLRKGLNVLIATPGRLLDHLRTTEVLRKQLTHLRWLILDEGDLLMDMGYEKQVKAILDVLESTFSVERPQVEGLPDRRQTLICSATLRDSIKQLTYLCMKNPLFITAEENFKTASIEEEEEEEEEDTDNEESENIYTLPKTLIQHYIVMPCKQRLWMLYAFIRERRQEKMIVFVSSCVAADFYFYFLTRWGGTDKTPCGKKKLLTRDDEKQNFIATLAGAEDEEISCYKLHGQMEQEERTRVYLAYIKTTKGILVCTDVAARGLDLPEVKWIIQYDPPTNVNDYIHRVGRTARLGRDGKSVIFLMESEIEYVIVLQKKTQQKLRRIVLEDDHLMNWKMDQLSIETLIENDSYGAALARSSYLAFVKAYATHCKAEKYIFHHKKLHYGHLAKSFALKDPPSQILRRQLEGNRYQGETSSIAPTSSKSSSFKMKRKRPAETTTITTTSTSRVARLAKTLITSEFYSGHNLKASSKRRKMNQNVSQEML
jgi:ATP-dependent RNA helicase DDX31/DBP7